MIMFRFPRVRKWVSDWTRTFLIWESNIKIFLWFISKRSFKMFLIFLDPLKHVLVMSGFVWGLSSVQLWLNYYWVNIINTRINSRFSVIEIFYMLYIKGVVKKVFGIVGPLGFVPICLCYVCGVVFGLRFEFGAIVVEWWCTEIGWWIIIEWIWKSIYVKIYCVWKWNNVNKLRIKNGNTVNIFKWKFLKPVYIFRHLWLLWYWWHE